MESFNRILSLFVGLFVLILVLFFVVKRFNLQKTFPLFDEKTVTPTPTKTLVQAQNVAAVDKTAETIKEKFTGSTTYGSSPDKNQTIAGKGGQTVQQAQSIPKTGVATLLLPISGISLLAGIYLRRKGKK